MKKILIFIIFAVLFGFVIYFNSQKSNTKTDVFTIKALVPLSGRAASVADSIRAGVELARDGLAKRYGNKFDVVLLDSGSDPTTALSIYKQQIEGRENNMALWWTLSPVGKAIKPLLKGNMLALSLTAADGLSDPGKNLFQLSPRTVDIKPALVDFIKKKNIKTVSVVYPGDTYGLENLHVVQAAVSEAGAQLVEKMQYSETDFDFRIQALKLKKKNPDMIFLVGIGNAYLSVLRDVYASEYTGILMADWTFSIPHFYTAYPKLTDRIYVMSTDLPKSFTDAYNAKYDKPAWMLQVGGAYDAVMLIAQACANTDCSPDEMGKFIASLKDYEGAMGRYSMNPSGDITVDVTVSKIKDGKIYPAE